MDRRRLIALALSLLVLPGAGHWYLGRRRTGGILAAVAITAALYPLLRYVRGITAALHDLAAAPIETAGGPLLALSMAWRHEFPWIVGGLILLLLLWLYAAADLLCRGAKRKSP